MVNTYFMPLTFSSTCKFLSGRGTNIYTEITRQFSRKIIQESEYLSSNLAYHNAETSTKSPHCTGIIVQPFIFIRSVYLFRICPSLLDTDFQTSLFSPSPVNLHRIMTQMSKAIERRRKTFIRINSRMYANKSTLAFNDHEETLFYGNEP